MSNLSVFAFEGDPVRFVGTADNPEWIAQDVCHVLAVGAAGNALRNFEPDEKGMYLIHTPGGEQSMLTVTEAGLYRLIFKSRKPSAKRFQRWVFHEVLPSIRKTGSYTLPQPEIERIKLELELIKAKQRYQDSAQAILTATSPAMLAYVRGDAPPPVKIEYRDRFVDAATGKEANRQSGRSLSQLIADAGLNPKLTRDRHRVKKILKCYGWDYDSARGWSTAAYLREYQVLPDEIYNQALKAVLTELTTGNEQPNLFVYQLRQASLPDSSDQARLKEVQ